MEEIKTRICPFCKEHMKYGLQKEVLCKVKFIDGNRISHHVNYHQYGWTCSMKKDPCDVIFDEHDKKKNKELEMKAEQRLLQLFETEENGEKSIYIQNTKPIKTQSSP